MAKPYSDDLRERVVRAVEGGSSRHEAAGRFGVSVSFVVKLMQRFHATGSFQPSDFGGHGKPKLAEHEAVVRELVEQTPSATLLELRRALLERGIEVGKSSIGRFLKRLRISYKNVWPAPSARGLSRLAADQSASTYPASRNRLRPRWRYARSGPHKTPGVRSRRFLNQDSEAPFDCQIPWGLGLRPKLGQSAATSQSPVGGDHAE